MSTDENYVSIICPNCSRKYRIGADKIPPGKTIMVKCVQCGEKIPVGLQKNPVSSQDSPLVSSEIPLKAQEYFQPGQKVAIVVADIKEPSNILKLLNDLGFETRVVNWPDELEGRFRLFTYPLCFFFQQGQQMQDNLLQLLVKASHLPAETRRKTFFLYCAPEGKRYDSLQAFSYSVDLVISHADLDRLKEFLPEAIREKELNYKPLFAIQEELQKKGLK